jgi:hypothetical protein
MNVRPAQKSEKKLILKLEKSKRVVPDYTKSIDFPSVRVAPIRRFSQSLETTPFPKLSRLSK